MYLNRLTVVPYTDDTIILADNPIDFQYNLDILVHMANNGNPWVNVTKTKYIIFGGRKNSVL